MPLDPDQQPGTDPSTEPHADSTDAPRRRLEGEVMPRLADDRAASRWCSTLLACVAISRALAPGEPETVDAQPARDAIPAVSGNGRLC